MPFARGRAGY